MLAHEAARPRRALQPAEERAEGLLADHWSIHLCRTPLGELDGVRMAEPGEFTRQAYFNGRMDLTEVEGLSDLINADTEAQRKQALRQMGGSQRERYNAWRQELLIKM